MTYLLENINTTIAKVAECIARDPKRAERLLCKVKGWIQELADAAPQADGQARNAALEEAAAVVGTVPVFNARFASGRLMVRPESRSAAAAIAEAIEAIRALKSAPAAQAPVKGADVALPPLPDLQFKMFYRSEVLAELEAYARVAVFADRQQRGGNVALPARWRFDISHIDGRAWLTITTPRKASATLSCASASEGGGETIGSQVLRYLSDDLALASLAAMSAQPAASAEPSDEEIMTVVREQCAGFDDAHEGPDEDDMTRIARALLSRYGRPAGDAQPVRWLVTGKCGNDEYTRAADEAQRAKQLRDESYCGEDGTQVVPLYSAPVAAQKADDALRAIKKIFDKPVTFVGDGPNSTVVVPFESHTQAWNHWHEAREIIDAAIAQQRKGES